MGRLGVHQGIHHAGLNPRIWVVQAQPNVRGVDADQPIDRLRAQGWVFGSGGGLERFFGRARVRGGCVRK